MGKTISNQTKSRADVKNPNHLPWRFGAIEVKDGVWASCMFDCNGFPVDLTDSELIRFVIECVNKNGKNQ